MSEAAAAAAEEVVEEFVKEWEPMKDAIKESVETFGTIDGEAHTSWLSRQLEMLELMRKIICSRDI